MTARANHLRLGWEPPAPVCTAGAARVAALPRVAALQEKHTDSGLAALRSTAA